MADSPYDTLKIKPDAGAEAIKKAYRQLVKQHHPDSGNGSADAFRKVQEAYELLSDPVKRRKYDAVRKVLLDQKPRDDEERKSSYPGTNPNYPSWTMGGYSGSGSIAFYSSSASSASYVTSNVYTQPVYSMGSQQPIGHLINASYTTISISMVMSPSSNQYKAMSAMGLRIGDVISIDPNTGMLGYTGLPLGQIQSSPTGVVVSGSGVLHFDLIIVSATGTISTQITDALRKMSGMSGVTATVSIKKSP